MRGAMKNVCIGMLLLAMVSSQVTAQDEGQEAFGDWPQWRGPSWNGVALQADPPVTWSETENLRWKTPVEGTGHGTPIVHGDRIFLQTAIPLDEEIPVPDAIPAGTPNIDVNPSESIVSWKPQRFAIVCIDRTSGDVLQAIRLGQSGDLTDSDSVVWSLFNGTPYVPCPMLWGQELYLLEDRSFFSCYNATDGAHRYKQRLPGTPNFSASPVGTADRIYLLSEEGRTVVLQRGPQYQELAVNELDEAFYASPAIVDDAIYLRGDKHLYCFAVD